MQVISILVGFILLMLMTVVLTIVVVSRVNGDDEPEEETICVKLCYDNANDDLVGYAKHPIS